MERRPAVERLLERAERVDLAWAALLAALLEVVLGRVLPIASARHLPRPLVFASDLTEYFAALLCTAVLVYGLALTLRRSDLFPRPARALLLLVGLILGPLLAWASVAPIPPFVTSQIESSFVFFAIACALAGLAVSAPGRLRLGLVLLVVPILARGYGVAAGALEPLAFHRLDVPQVAKHVGETAALIAATAAPMVLVPDRELIRMFTPRILGGVLVTVVTGAVLAWLRPELAQSLAAALGFALPEELLGRTVYLMSLSGVSWALVVLLSAKGEACLVGIGLALVTLSGYALERPAQLAETAVGILIVLWGQAGAQKLGPAELRPFDAEAWRTEVKGLAERLGGECLTVQDGAREITRISGERSGQSFVIRVIRQKRDDEIEVVVGRASWQKVCPAPASVAEIEQAVERLGAAG